MSTGKTKNPQVMHSWGILLGALAIAVLALIDKLYPTLETLWAVLGVLACALIMRSAIGFLFPASAAAPEKKTRHPAAHAP